MVNSSTLSPTSLKNISYSATPDHGSPHTTLCIRAWCLLRPLIKGILCKLCLNLSYSWRFEWNFIQFYPIFQSTYKYVDCTKLFEDIWYSASQVPECHQHELVVTYRLLFTVHNEMVRCPSAQNQLDVSMYYKKQVAGVKAQSTKFLESVAGNQCSQEVVQPIAEAFRTVLKLSEVKILNDLQIFAAARIKVCPPSFLYLNGLLN